MFGFLKLLRQEGWTARRSWVRSFKRNVSNKAYIRINDAPAPHNADCGDGAFVTVCIAIRRGGPRRPIKATLVQDMDFGSVVATSPTGTVTLYPTGQSPLYSGVVSIGGIVAPAAFSVSGEKFLPFTIILPTAPIVIPGPTGNMVIDGFVSVPPAGANGTFDAQGKATVTIGATMYVTDQLSTGPYNSTFDLVVSY